MESIPICWYLFLNKNDKKQQVMERCKSLILLTSKPKYMTKKSMFGLKPSFRHNH